MTIDRHNIGAVLRQHIQTKYGTQKDASKALGIDPATLSHSLNGHPHPSPILLADAGLVARVVYEQKVVPFQTEKGAQ